MYWTYVKTHTRSLVTRVLIFTFKRIQDIFVLASALDEIVG